MRAVHGYLKKSEVTDAIPPKAPLIYLINNLPVNSKKRWNQDLIKTQKN